MKTLIAAIFFLLPLGCAVPQTKNLPVTETKAEKTPENIQAEKTPEMSLDELTKEQKKKLDKSINAKTREILDKAEALDIFASVNKETKKLDIIFGKGINTVAKITDAQLKKAILDSFYFNAANGSGAAACWNPRHQLEAKYKDKTVSITICFDCSSFKGSSPFGEIYGSLGDPDNKSMNLLNQAIEKYGVDVQ